MPNYISSLESLCDYVKKDGILYIDHEASPYYWAIEKSMLSSIIKGITPPDPIEKNNSQTKYNFTGMFPQIPYDSTVIPLAFKIDANVIER